MKSFALLLGSLLAFGALGCSGGDDKPVATGEIKTNSAAAADIAKNGIKPRQENHPPLDK